MTNPDMTIVSSGELLDFDESDLHTSCDAYSDEDTQGDTFDDSMDGDAESAFTSVGWGVDESYTMENDYFDDF